MFAFKSLKEMTVRVLLIAVILSNALTPTTVAQAKQEKEAGSTRQSNLQVVKEESRSIPTFERPKARMNVLHQAETPKATGTAMSSAFLSCVQPISACTSLTSCTCSQLDPYTVEITGEGLDGGTNHPSGSIPYGYQLHLSAPSTLYTYVSLGGTQDYYYTTDTSLLLDYTVQFYQSPFISPPGPGLVSEDVPVGNGYIYDLYLRVDFQQDAMFQFDGWQVGDVDTAVGTGPHGVSRYSYTGYRQIISSMSFLDPNSVLFSGIGWSAGAFGGLGPIESSCNVSCVNGSQGVGGDPINTRSGAFSTTLSDLSFPTSAGELIFQRSYSSGAAALYNLPLGHGWTHNHDAKLILPSDPGGSAGYIIFKDVVGNQHKFKIESNDSYLPAPGVVASLTKSATEYTLAASDQSIFRFDLTGRLTSRANAQGHAFNYHYDTQGRLDKVSADAEHFIQINYDTPNRVVVSDYDGRQVSYDFDANGDLISATDVLGQTWTYTYDNAHRMTQVNDPNEAVTLITEYDSEGRAFRQWDGLGNKLVELTYNTDGTTTVTDALDKEQTHTYDWRGTLTTQENSVGGEQEKQYDINFRPGLVIDALENEATLQWSDDGANLEYIKDAANGETFIYYDEPNSPNSPTRIIDPLDQETKYFYTNTDFPTLPTQIEYYDENDTLITSTDYQYYSSGAAAGKVEQITDALNHKTHYTYTSLGQPDIVVTAYQTDKAQTTDYDYDDLGRVIRVKDASGVVTRHEYDNAGRRVITINNVDPSIPPENRDLPPQNLVSGDNTYNLYTRYYYDERNNKIAVVDTEWNITRTYYDLADRPVGSVQNLVINSTPASSDVEARTAIDTPLVSVPAYSSNHPDWNIPTDTEYDDVGNVIVTRDPQGIITRTYYDEANRPKVEIQNWAGADLYGGISTAPAFNPALPDQNVRTEYFYDLNGNVIATKDTLGAYTRIYYDVLNRPVVVIQNFNVDGTPDDSDINTPLNEVPGYSSTYPDRNIRTSTYYDADGNVIATKDPRNVITATYYDALNRPVAVIQNIAGASHTETEITLPDFGQLQCGSDANICSFTHYDQFGNVIATADPRGVVTRTYYDEANRPAITVQNLVGQSVYVNTPPARGTNQNIRTDIAYDLNGRRDTSTDPLNRVTKYEYNELGQVLKVTANYVNGGTPQNDQDQRNIVTTYAYDELGRQTRITDTLGRVTLNVYDDLGRVTSTTRNYVQSPAGYHQDSNGNQYNLTTTYIYDVRSSQIAVTDPAGVVTRTYYDALSRPVTIVRNLDGSISAAPPERANPPDPSENLRTDTVYLGNGNVDYVTDETGKVTDYDYDDLGRLVTSVDPFQKPTNFEYDANGNRTLITDAETVATRYEYDALNRLQAVVENYRAGITPDHETNVRTEYTYDTSGNRLGILDGNNHSTSFTYSALGQLETEVDALGHTTTYAYDALGNRLSLLDANGETTNYGYDELNRLVSINYPDPDADVAFDYDALGRRQSMNDGLGVTAWDYNNLDLPDTITDPFSASVSYSYDAAGNRTSLTYPDSVVNYQYNDVNRLEAVTSGQQQIAGYQYDAVGRVKAVQRANGVNTLYNYYDNGWLQNITHASGATTLASYAYQYDDVGNRTQAVETIQYPQMASMPSGTFAKSTVPQPQSASADKARFAPAPQAEALDTPVYTYTSQPDGVTGEDTYLLSKPANKTHGDEVEIGVGESRDDNDHVARGLIKFDLSSIPDNAVVTSARLSLWTSADLAESDRTLHVYRLKTAFDESTATWKESAVGAKWDKEGASGENDRENVEIGFAPILANEPVGMEKQIVLAPSKVQEWIDGTFANHGFLIVVDTEVDDRFSYESSDSAADSKRPMLVIQYTLPEEGDPSDEIPPAEDTAPPPLSGEDVPLEANGLSLLSSPCTSSSVSLLHMNGADASTTFTDELEKTWTANGNAQIDTGQSVFGGASALFDGTGDYLTTPDSDDFHLSNVDWTMEFRVRFNAINGTPINLVSQYQDNNNWMDVWLNSGRLYFAHKAGGATTAQFSAGVSFTTNTWYHIVIERNGNTPKIAVNGTLLTVAETTTISGKTLSNLSGPLTIGAYNGTGALNGWIDEFRFRKGIARWTSNFTPPASEYTHVCFPEAATLISPTGSIATTTPTYTWSEVSDATWYYLWVNGPSGNVFKQWYSSAQANCNSGTCSITPATTLGSGTHTWWIQTWNEEGYGPWSASMSFTPTLPGKATLTSPNGNSVTVTPTYTWNEVPGTTWYYLQVNGPSGNVILQWYEASAICTGGTCSITPAVTLAGGSHTWWVRTWNSVGYGPWSDGMTFIPAQVTTETITINYDYDPLYRLTAADYSNNDYYHYTYDAVGNRLTQSNLVGGLPSTDAYIYDDANRLTSVDGVNYAWDNNGNLLNDGVKTYTYDPANRLKTISDQSAVSSFQYNGLGDRLQETADGQTTTFTMDLNGGLTQALSDGTYTYLYGNGRLAQTQGSTAEYFLGDALGSVRQLTNTTGAVTYAGAYDPYGVTRQTSGTSQSVYGYTGEYTSNEMVYLRARYYAPASGRFNTKDSWQGDYNRPLSLNRWNYVEGNPINRTDPSGRCFNPDGSWEFRLPLFGPCPVNTTSGPSMTMTPTMVAIIASAICTPTPTNTLTPTSTPIPLAIVGFPNITISNPQDWTKAEIAELTSVLKDEVLPAFVNSPITFANAVGNISVTVVPDYSIGDGWAEAPFDQINYEHRILTGTHRFGIIHEIGHQVDWQEHESDAQKLQWRSQQFVDDPAINKSGCTGDRLQCRYSYTDKDSPNGIRPSEAYANAFAAYILGRCSHCNVQAEKLDIIQNDIHPR